MIEFIDLNAHPDGKLLRLVVEATKLHDALQLGGPEHIRWLTEKIIAATNIMELSDEIAAISALTADGWHAKAVFGLLYEGPGMTRARCMRSRIPRCATGSSIMSGQAISRRVALTAAGMASVIGLPAAPHAPKFHELTEAEHERLTELLLRRIADNLGITKKMDAKFGELEWPWQCGVVSREVV